MKLPRVPFDVSEDQRSSLKARIVTPHHMRTFKMKQSPTFKKLERICVYIKNV